MVGLIDDTQVSLFSCMGVGGGRSAFLVKFFKTKNAGEAI